jgi:hypothetical protein
MNGLRGHQVWMGAAFVASAVLLAVGFWPSQNWAGIVVPLAAAAIWVLIRKWDVFWASSLAFLAILLGAVGGLWLNLNPFVLIASATAGLAAWDLALFSHEQPPDPVSPDPASPDPASLDPLNDREAHGTRRRLNRHLFWLALALGLGFLLAAFGLILHLNLPFGVVMILALAAFITLVMAAVRIINKSE